MKRFTALFLLLFSATSFAEKAQDWAKGKLVDLQRYDTDAGAARAQAEYCFSVEVGDTVYLTRYQPYWRHSYDPTSLVVGDPIEALVNGKTLLLRKPDGTPLKTHISRRERVEAGKHPTSCAARIQSD